MEVAKVCRTTGEMMAVNRERRKKHRAVREVGMMERNMWEGRHVRRQRAQDERERERE